MEGRGIHKARELSDRAGATNLPKGGKVNRLCTDIFSRVFDWEQVSHGMIQVL